MHWVVWKQSNTRRAGKPRHVEVQQLPWPYVLCCCADSQNCHSSDDTPVVSMTRKEEEAGLGSLKIAVSYKCWFIFFVARTQQVSEGSILLSLLHKATGWIFFFILIDQWRSKKKFECCCLFRQRAWVKGCSSVKASETHASLSILYPDSCCVNYSWIWSSKWSPVRLQKGMTCLPWI